MRKQRKRKEKPQTSPFTLLSNKEGTKAISRRFPQMQMIKIWSGSHLAPLADNHVRRQVALTCNIQSVSSYIFTKVGHAVADFALVLKHSKSGQSCQSSGCPHVKRLVSFIIYFYQSWPCGCGLCPHAFRTSAYVLKFSKSVYDICTVSEYTQTHKPHICDLSANADIGINGIQNVVLQP